jgi:hypothetical protein
MDLITSLNNALQTTWPQNISPDELKEKLSAYINHLIQTDFQKLVNILYRADINESELKRLLKENPDKDAGQMIAELITERQQQKINTRQQYRGDATIPDDEKW